MKTTLAVFAQVIIPGSTLSGHESMKIDYQAVVTGQSIGQQQQRNNFICFYQYYPKNYRGKNTCLFDIKISERRIGHFYLERNL